MQRRNKMEIWRFNHFVPRSSLEVWDHSHWQIKWTSFEPWWGHDRKIRKRHGCRNNSNSSLLSFKAIWSDRDCRQGGNSEGEGLNCLLTTNGVLLDISIRRSISAPNMLNYWIWVPVHVVYWESSPVLPANTACALISKVVVKLQNNLPTNWWQPLKISTTSFSLLHFLHVCQMIFSFILLYIYSKSISLITFNTAAT